VYRLAIVPSGDGVLLASGDTRGGVLVWDGRTGEPVAGLVTVDSVTVTDLAAVRLHAGDWALACCGADSVTLWDPSRIGRPGYGPRRLVETGAMAMAVIPGEPQLIVVADAKAVRVIDPTSGQQVFGFPQPPHPKGHIGDQVHQLVGVRFDDETVGFAAARYGGTLELWAPVNDTWRRQHSTRGMHGRGGLTAFGTQLAITARRGIEVWDLQSGERTARGELDTPFEVLAPVSLGPRTVIAAAFRAHHDCGVRLWDPQHPTSLSAPFNRHGPAFGDSRFGSATINAVAAISHPDSSPRLASAANDGCVLVSAPLDEHDLVPGQHPGPAPAQRGSGNFAQVRTTDGEIVGLWFASITHARDRMLIETVLFGEDLQHLLGTEHRVVPNTYDDRGGAFVMFGHHLAPGEPDHT
jgi:WD40 repeat protein